MEDCDLTQAIQQTVTLVENILDFKTIHFNNVLGEFLKRKNFEKDQMEKIHGLTIDLRRQAKTPIEEIKQMISKALTTLKDSSLWLGRTVPAQSLINLWANGIQIYKSKVSILLYDLRVLKHPLQIDCANDYGQGYRSFATN